jgi:hypothetical protein
MPTTTIQERLTELQDLMVNLQFDAPSGMTRVLTTPESVLLRLLAIIAELDREVEGLQKGRDAK